VGIDIGDGAGFVAEEGDGINEEVVVGVGVAVGLGVSVEIADSEAST
jgi:hypothetical protein